MNQTFPSPGHAGGTNKQLSLGAPSDVGAHEYPAGSRRAEWEVAEPYADNECKFAFRRKAGPAELEQPVQDIQKADQGDNIPVSHRQRAQDAEIYLQNNDVVQS